MFELLGFMELEGYYQPFVKIMVAKYP